MCILSEDLTEVLPAGHDGMGWLAQAGRVPLGYLGDADKSARTFPVIDGVRYSVPGDRARLTADDRLELYGRDSVTINSGGEKIFAEEVEAGARRPSRGRRLVVAGRPSERWGNEVVAIVAVASGRRRVRRRPPRGGGPSHRPLQVARRRSFAGRQIQRSPSGKADYRWATAQAADG